MARIAYVEPFEGGSHAAFGRTLRAGLPEHDWTSFTLPARHWKWRMRGSGVHLSGDPRWEGGFDLLFASSYLPLADFLALRPELHGLPRVLYFHENQLAFPMRPEFSGERDLHYGFSQLVSALAATQCWFNSRWNLESFVDAGRRLLKMMPDANCPDWMDAIEARSRVMPLPLDLPDLPDLTDKTDKTEAETDAGHVPLIVWNHRWEFDKGPEAFFAGLDSLMQAGRSFRVAVLGQGFQKRPKCFAEARARLEAYAGAEIVQWGYVESRAAYWSLLCEADVAVSTAEHEFFGISMLEAAHAGTLVLVPNELAYPEVFDMEFTYSRDDFHTALGTVTARPVPAQARRRLRDIASAYHSREILPRYAEAFAALVPS